MKYNYEEYLNKKIENMTTNQKDEELKKLYLQNRKWSEKITQLKHKINNMKSIIRDLKGLDEHDRWNTKRE